MSKGVVNFDIDISGLKQLWLLEQDAGSYDPAHTVAGWIRVEFFGPQGVKDLADLAPAGFARQPLTANKEPVGWAVGMPPGSQVVIPIDGLGFVRMRGRVALDDRSTSDDNQGAVRFFIFGAAPDRERLVRVSGLPPAPAPPPIKSVDEAGQRLYLQLFARKPNSQEARIVKEYFAGCKPEPAALEDLLWSLLLHPEFQFLY